MKHLKLILSGLRGANTPPCVFNKASRLAVALFAAFALSIGQVWAETVTYSVTSTSAVSTTGTAPDGASATYSQTYNTLKQATANNSFTLTLSGYEGYKITAISLSMKSNAKAGAGSLSVQAGSTTLCSISNANFNNSSWYGAYSSSYVSITPTMTDADYEIQENENVVFSIACTTNSLYCESYTITYEEAGSTCQTLDAPTNPSATPAQTSVVLSWDAVTGASGYKVVFNGTEYNIAENVTTKTIEELAMETEYHWTVAAKGDGTTYCASGTATAQQDVTTLGACVDNKVTYVVASTSSVTPTDAPEETSATFANTYVNNKEQMTSGNSQTLTLSGYDNKVIKGLTLKMHSNAKAGAGTFSMTIGGTSVAAISSATAFNEWFDNNSYGQDYRAVHVNVTETQVGVGEDIVIVIAATTNSLFCSQFDLCYADGTVPTPTTVATPVISGTESFYPTTSVSISCTTEGATIYYTMDGNTPTSASTLYSAPFTVSAEGTTTVKAIAIKTGLDNSEVASKDFTKVTPLATMQDIFNAATGTEANQYITFSNTWVVTGVSTNGQSAYLTDGTKGLILFNNGASQQSPVGGLAVGNTLSGTVIRSLKLYNGAAELVGFTAEGLIKGTADEPAVNNLDAEGIAALSGVNTGSLIQISGQCIQDGTKYYIKYGSGDNDKVQVYNTLYAFGPLTTNANYTLTGVYIQYNSTKEIAPRSSADIVQQVVKTQPETQWDATAKSVRMGDATTGWWSTSSDGAKSFSSSNTSVATITNAGVITLVAPGTTTLTFSTAETNDYYAGNASLTLTVKAALPDGATEFTWVAAEWAEANEITSNTAITSIDANSDISMTWNQNTGSSSPAFNYNNVDVRLYRYNSVTFESKNGKLFAGITLNFRTNTVKGSDMAANCGTYDPATGEWSGLSKSVTITNTGTENVQANMTSIEFVYLDGTVTTLSIDNVAMKTTDEPFTIAPTCNVTPTPAISYEIATADQQYATIENGIITPHAVTTTPITVTASIEEGSNYTAASTTFTITVTEKQMPTLSFPATSYDANLGSDFEEPELTNSNNVSPIVYSSSETGVATVNASTGAIELVGEGTTTITAAFAGNGEYAANSAFYTLNVADPYKDYFTADNIGVTSTSYGDWELNTFGSGITYSGNSAKNGTNIQIRSDKSSSGIVSTTTLGYVRSVVISSMQADRTLDVYGSNNAYTNPTDLYGDNKGTLIGSLTSESLSLSITDNYKYVGLRSRSGAIQQLSDITIKWEPVTFQKYTVTYEAGDATGDDVVIDNIEDGTTIQLQDNSYSYAGHIFTGWSDGENVYKEGDDYTITGNVTFTAQWAQQFNVTYNPGDAGGDAIVRTVAAGAYNLEAGNIFTYAGHAFDGWLIGETKYNAGASYPISEDVAFTAQWVEAEDPVTVTFVAGTDKSANNSIVKDGITVAVSSGDLNRTDDYRCYSGYSMTISSEVGNITDIVIVSTSDKPASAFSLEGDNGVYSYESSTSTGTWNGSSEEIQFNASAQVRMTQIAVTYIPNGNTPKQPADLSYTPNSYSITQGESFTAPMLNNPDNLTVTYSANNDAVATVNAQNGAITLTGTAGTVTVTATFAGNDAYLAGTASYTLKVKEPADKTDGQWKRVTSTADLVDGMRVVVAQYVADPTGEQPVTVYTMGKANENNRAAVASELANTGVLTPEEGTCVFTLVAQDGGTYAIKASNGKYLYAASSSSNNLKEKAGLDADGNSLWAISFSDGQATITAQGDKTHNVMRYNSGSNLFSCYTNGGQSAIALYSKLSKINGNTNASTLDDYADVVAEGNATLVINTTGKPLGVISCNVEVVEPLVAEGVHLGVNHTMTVSNTVTVPSFSIKAKLGGVVVEETSLGEATNVTVNGNGSIVAPEGYIDIELADNANPDHWHAFTVPFPVDVMNGIYDTLDNKLTNEVNYAIMDYHGDIRANGLYGWKKFRGVMTPGTFYMLTIDGETKVLRLKKTSTGAYVDNNNIEMPAYTGSGDTDKDFGWNGVGNPTMFRGKVGFIAQMLNDEGTGFVPYPANGATFSAAMPFFIKVTGSTAYLSVITPTLAPERVPMNEIVNLAVDFKSASYTDRLYISAREDALNSYEEGKDLVKMMMSSAPSIPQIFGSAYGNKLCMVDAPLVNNQAVYDLELYAPAAGTYTLSAEAVDGADLYVTYEGNIVWNLSLGDYELDLTRGTTTGYGLMLIAQPNQMPTGVQETEGMAGDAVQKLLLNGNLYILKDGHLYDAVGKQAK